MPAIKVLKLIHFSGTVWVILNVAFLLAAAMRQAKVHWWVIFSVSGYSVVAVFLLVSVYLFALYRGVVRIEEQIEHPLTVSIYYRALYDSSPFIGAAAAMLCNFGNAEAGTNVLAANIAIGSLSTTFLVWVVLDPAIGLIENILPVSRIHRHRRLAQARIDREQQQQQSQTLLEELLEREKIDKSRRAELLQPMAEQLTTLICHYRCGDGATESRAFGIGGQAWRIGGLDCMRQLHEMVREKTEILPCHAQDYIPFWWEGIGDWRCTEMAGFDTDNALSARY